MNELTTASLLHEHMNLSYKRIDDTITNINLERSLLNGTHINSELIDNCNMKLTEWSGAKITNCTLKNSDFKYAEIKSTWFKNSSFYNIIFDDTIIADSTFSNCKFFNCSLAGTFFQENKFNNCSFDTISFSEASANLNIFTECHFIKSNISGSFYYSIFNNCNIDACKIDQYLLGYILGFFNSRLKDVTYLKGNGIYQGTIDDMLSDLNTEYERRMKFVNRAILELNIGKDDNIDFLIFACIRAFIMYSQHDITISSDDIKFIKYIIESYYNKNMISPCMVFEAGLMLRREIQRIDDEYEQNKQQLNSLYNCLFFYQQDFVTNYNNELNIAKNATYTLFIKYNEKPLIHATDILTELSPESKTQPCVLKTKTGSFLEWIQCDGNAITMFGFLLDFLGVGVPIIYDILKEKHKKNKNNEKEKETSTNITNININSLQISLNNNNFQAINNILNVVGNKNFSVSNGFNGYNKLNIQEINITLT